MNGQKEKKKIIIIGAGPGGLTSAMILSKRGFDVHLYEKNGIVGGRNGCIINKGYKFDIGPTFLMMKFVLDEVFHEAGKDINNYLKFIKLDPMYRLIFSDKTIDVTDDHEKMREIIAKNFPGNEKGYDKLLEREKKRFEKMYVCLQKDYSKIKTMLHPDLLKALPYLSVTRSMYKELGRYFNNEDLKISFTFQSKYLGMSPWDCPAAFMIIPFIEHQFGIYHPIGGLSEISEAMAKVAKENGAKIYLNTPVKQLIVLNKSVKGIELENGKKAYADEVIINADFGYAASKLFPPNVLKKYSPKKLEKKKFSCSTFMLYLGVKKQYNLPHHSIVFSKDYNKYINDVFKKDDLLDDISFYIRNGSINDPTLAPKDKSNIYVLVPVQNKTKKVDWNKEKKKFRDLIIKSIMERTDMKDLDKNIEVEQIVTPDDWENSMNVHLGATFNLAHTLGQMLYFRPRNKFEEVDNCYLVGGGTHPGSGLPTIYESGRITSNIISKKHKIMFETFNMQV
jgi:phytoene desaturase